MSTEHKLHPIQIEGIKVKELFVRDNFSNETPQDDLVGKFKMKVSHSAFDAENQMITIGLVIELGEPNSIEPVNGTVDLRVQLMAKFSVDTDTFPREKLEHWAQHNAPMILYPYAREQVYSLSSRALDNPILLPLLQVPTLKI